MVDAETVEDRDALYYPFIHFRNENWLRTALLFFPHVMRMVPPEFNLNDSEFISKLAQTKNDQEKPLVGSYLLNSYEAYQAGERLAARFDIDTTNPEFCAKYSRQATAAKFEHDSVFQIHHQKFADALRCSLEKANLIWNPSQPNRGDWLAVHPVIGEIVMSTAAAAAARGKGFDILTDIDRNHLITSTRNEDVIYNALLGRSEEETVGDDRRRPTGQQIGDLVIATSFDLSDLTSDDFVALSKERDALFDFRKLLAERSMRIPVMGDPAERDRRAKEAAGIIFDEWENKRTTWGRFLRRVFRVEAAGEAKDAATDLLKVFVPTAAGAGATATTGAAGAGGALSGGAAAGAGTFSAMGSTFLGAVPGLAVGLTWYGVTTWQTLKEEEEGAPTRFLSRVVDKGGVLSSSTVASSE